MYITPLLSLGFNENKHRTHTLQARCGTFTLLQFLLLPFKKLVISQPELQNLQCQVYRNRGGVRKNSKKMAFCFWGGVGTPTFVADKRAGLSEILSASYARVYI